MARSGGGAAAIAATSAARSGIGSPRQQQCGKNWNGDAGAHGETLFHDHSEV